MSKGVKIKKLKYNLLMNIKIENNDNIYRKTSKPTSNYLDYNNNNHCRWVI